MIVIDAMQTHGSEREVKRDDLSSMLLLLKADGLGFTVTRTMIHPAKDFEPFHDKDHVQAYYCIRGNGTVKDSRGNEHKIKPGFFFAAEKAEKHWIKAKDTLVLLCTISPAIAANEMQKVIE